MTRPTLLSILVIFLGKAFTVSFENRIGNLCIQTLVKYFCIIECNTKQFFYILVHDIGACENKVLGVILSNFPTFELR